MQELQIKMFALQTIDHARDKRKRPLSLITSYQSQLEKDKKTKKQNEKKDTREGSRFQVEIPRQESNPCKIAQNTFTKIQQNQRSRKTTQTMPTMQN